jgi:AraC family transcriptional regulator
MRHASQSRTGPKKARTASRHASRIGDVLSYIQENLDRSLSLRELALKARYSPYHFHRVFHAIVGESLQQHMRRLKLERAAHQLRQSHSSVTQVASWAGYFTPESFSRAFAAHFGVPPRRFREATRPYELPAARVRFDPDGAARLDPPLCTPRIPVRVDWIPPLHVAAIRHVGPYEEADEALEKLMRWAEGCGLLRASPKLLGAAYDDPTITHPSRLRYDAAIVLPANARVAKGAARRTLAGGRYAVTTHRGPYESLGDAYKRICGDWMELNRRTLGPGPALEFYRITPAFGKSDGIVTDVCMPLSG